MPQFASHLRVGLCGQGAGFAYDKESDEGYVARKEFAFALIGLLVCIFELGAYLRYQYQVRSSGGAFGTGAGVSMLL